MPFDMLKADIPLAPLPARAKRLIDAADQLGDRFFAEGGQRRNPRFVPSHAELVYSGLAYAREHDLALGDRFLEWGSGLGVSSCLAALLGFHATGIEIETRLVELARGLARQFQLPTDFLNGSYFPPGLSAYQAQGGSELIRTGHRESPQLPFAYPDSDFTLDEVDLFFVYPWPEEQDLMLQLFDATASPDALLLIHFGPKELCLYRKT